jgi:enamine deaminase RidA (YjgF/YER057c/UK114 family)
MKALLPPGWPRPKGYSNGIAASGRFVFTGGVVGWDQQERFPLDTLVGQFEQTLRNIVAILAEGGAAPEHIVRMTCYVTSVDDYLASLKDIGAAWKGVIGAHYPTMALVEVVRLVEREAKVEIEATAVVPE